jgi:hypothetical protein
MIAACPVTIVQPAFLPGAPAGVPWVKASPGLAGIVFGARHGATTLELPTGGAWADGHTAKVLWWPRKRGGGRSIAIRGRSLDGGGTFLEKFPASGGNFPSIVDFPSLGCWRVDLSTGKLRGTVYVNAVSP